MSRKTRYHLIFSSLFVACAFVLNWLIAGETSPLNEYFLWHVGVPNAWSGLNLFPALIAAIAAGNIHGGNEAVFYLAFAIQWFAVGLVVSFIVRAFKHKPFEPTSISK